MLYLTRLILNPRSRQVRAEMRDPYQMHRTLSKAFSDVNARYREAHSLFRIDEASIGEGPTLLVQSLFRPDWSLLEKMSRYLISGPETKEFDPVLRQDQILAFRLRANPTVKRGGKRIGLYRDEDQLQWLERKAQLGGFRPFRIRVKRESPIQFQTGSGSTARFSVAPFDGYLQVSDPKKISQTLKGGIGSGKAFGFGLLSLAKP